MPEDPTTRLDKYLSGLGFASRRKVADFLAAHHVTLNSKRATDPGSRFTPGTDQPLLDGKPLVPVTDNPVYFILNKPPGVVSTTAPQAGETTVTDLVNSKTRLFPVGRLDKESTGLILLTNDGDLTFKLTHPKFHIPKVYHAVVVGKPTFRQLMLLRAGVRLKDARTKPARVDKIASDDSSTTLAITISEGRRRQIRRMCAGINLHLISLKRIAVGPLTLGDLPLGQFRPLTAQELKLLKSTPEN